MEIKHKYNRIIIVGCGGTGSNLIPPLCQLIGMSEKLKRSTELVFVDPDIIEPKNLRNQKFLLEDVGQCKAEVLFNRYSSIYPSINMSYVNEYVTNKEQLINYMLGDKDTKYRTDSQLITLVSCVDNLKARKIFHEVFISEGPLYNVLYIDTGNSIGDKLTGQTAVGYRTYKNKQIKHPKHGFEAVYMTREPVIVLPPVAEYFPEILTDEDIEEEPTCGDTNEATVQNLGANFTSACTTFNILNNILCFNQIPGQFYIFDAKEVEVKKRTVGSL